MSGFVRLNLGCGDKTLPGYINVDVVVERAGKQPDVNCDIRRLDIFPSDHADEVMAVHVVEHFWRWEVEDILREWIRVLKPGGKLILECPNLKSACEEFLKDPDLKARADVSGQTTMWVFYGDPAWKDPLMIHRWGYTPESLSQLMKDAGLINVAQHPAQFKMRDPCDMRVIGEKPAASVAALPRQEKIVHWLMPGDISHPSTIGTSKLASLRLRAGTLLGQLGRRGWGLTVGEHIHPEAKICVVGKIGVSDDASRAGRWMDSLAKAQQKGCRLIVDYTDNHLEIPSPMSPFYQDMLDITNFYSCSSSKLAQALARATGHSDNISVIPDGIEVPVTPPKSGVSDPVTVLWFGHSSNLEYLVKSLSKFPKDKMTKLLFLTNMEGINWLRSINFKAPSHIQMTGGEWSVAAMLQASKLADVCIIPSDPGDLRKSGASANRLITALAMGLPTAASLLDSYAEHREYFVDIESDQFLEMLKAPLNFSAQVRAAQERVVPGFAPDVLAASWISLFERAQLA